MNQTGITCGQTDESQMISLFYLHVFFFDFDVAEPVADLNMGVKQDQP